MNKINNLISSNITLLSKALTTLLIFFIFKTNIHSQQSLFLNEIASCNTNILCDLDFGKYSDYIELYNQSKKEINLEGYSIKNGAKIWIFPSNSTIKGNSYLILWADGLNYFPGDTHNILQFKNSHYWENIYSFPIKEYHLNFKIKNIGEQITLYDNQGEIKDHINIKKQLCNQPIGRNENTLDWQYLACASPGNSNGTTGNANLEKADNPIFSFSAGTYSKALNLTLSILKENSEIRYTVDGSIPRSDSKLYTKAITINETKTICARAFDQNKLQSDIIINTYFINDTFNLPVFSITTDPENLWDSVRGIYVRGNNGISGFTKDTANWFQNWEKPINIQYFNKNGDLQFNQNCGVKIKGLGNRKNDMKTLSIYANSKYGKELFNYQLFEEKNIQNFEGFVLRNHGGDFGQSYMRDGLMQTIVQKYMKLDYQAYKPVVVYLNGDYWGIHNLREKTNGVYVKSNFNIENESYDLIEFFINPTANEGDLDAYNKLIESLSYCDINNYSCYNAIKDIIDIDQFIDYQIAQIYFANGDWPGNNMKLWKSEYGKWKLLLFDTEYGFALGRNGHYKYNSMEYAASNIRTSTWNDLNVTFIFRMLLKNDEFKSQFISKFATHLGSTFAPSRILKVIDSLKKNLNPEIERHIKRWGLPNSVKEWEGTKIKELRDFAINRPKYCLEHLIDFFGLKEITTLNTRLRPQNAGLIYINGIEIPKTVTSLQLPLNMNVNIEVIPKLGYVFKSSKGLKNQNSNKTFNISEKTNYEAILKKKSMNILPSRIREKVEISDTTQPYYVSSNLEILKNGELTINRGVTLLLPNEGQIIVKGKLNVLGEKDNMVIIDVDSTHPYRKNLYNKIDPRWGAIIFESAQQSKLNYLNLKNVSFGKLRSEYPAAINSNKTDLKLNNIVISSAPFPIFTKFGNIFIYDCKLTSTKTCDLINIKYADTAIVSNCNLKGADAPDTDGIDFDGIKKYGLISNNSIYHFLGINNDGIDIGEKSKNIEIQNNRITNCNDKGVSVGQGSKVKLLRNIISYCHYGVGVKDYNSEAEIDHSTFYKNSVDVACYEKNIGKGGGKSIVTNTIFANSLKEPYFIDSVSNIKISFSISNTKPLGGRNNRQNNPYLKMPEIHDYSLSHISPCINHGDPNYILDRDSSNTDIGASTFIKK
ncbi:CotH kinase family protein [Flavobacteriales bacterium]|nr:CotH kinase family protein [Flavobacteriales bacterium]